MSDITHDIANHLREERRKQERRHQEWLYGTLNSVYRYQWMSIAIGRNVDVTWTFQPWPPAVWKKLRLGVAKRVVQHWTSRSVHGVTPSQTNRAKLFVRYGPFLKTVKPKYWSDCDGSEPTLFHRDPEWTLESWLEHRRATMSDWTPEDDERKRQWFRERYGDPDLARTDGETP